MDPNTNTPTDPNEPLPLGGPLHPHTPVSSDPPAAPDVAPPQPQIQPPPQPQLEPSLPAQAFVPNMGPSPMTPSPMPPSDSATPLPPPVPGSAFAPTQAPLGPPASPLPPGASAAPAFNPQSAFNPQVPAGPPPPPAGPVVVSGGFDPGAPATPVVGAIDLTAAPSPVPPANGRRLRRLLVVLAGIIVLAGGSAAAYFGVVVPNQPANVLKTALFNSVKQNSVSYKGTLGYQSLGTGSSIPPFQLTLAGSRNATANASDFGLGFDGYGVKINLEARLVDKNLYLKTGDLSTLAALAGTYEPTLASTATTISNDLSNQWIEVDQSLLDEGGLSCFINNGFSFSQADINLLSSDYSKHEFLAIQKTSNATVNGQAAEEFQVNIVDNTAAGFITGIGNLSTVKTLETCKDSGDLSSALTKVKGDGKTTPLTIWVSKANKQIIQLGFASTQAELKSSHIKGTLVVALNYSPVSISVPANSESVIQLYTKLQPTLSGLSSSGLNLTNPFSSLSSSASSASTSLLKLK
jgi:hypothetical protein